MTPAAHEALLALLTEFIDRPHQMSLPALERLEHYLTQLIRDTQEEEAKRLVATLTCASVRWWTRKRLEELTPP